MSASELRLEEPTPDLLPDDDLVGILLRAAVQEDLNASLQRGALADFPELEADLRRVLEWCEKKARAFRAAAEKLRGLA